MNRHRFRWQGAAFGTILLIVAGSWTVWQTDLLTPREFSLALSVALIVAGMLGVAATFYPRPAPTSTPTATHSLEVPDEQATDPQQ